MAGQESLRAAAARDKEFVGLDIAAMAHLIRQMSDASEAINGWLRTNGALPPSVPRTGLRQAAAVRTWTAGQPGMLTRRRNYAITHLGKGGHTMPRVGARGLSGKAGRSTRRTTPVGAGRDLGHFPDVHAAMKAGAADAAAVRKAVEAHRPLPAEVWRRLAADADDPDYAHGFYAKLGPAGTADLIKAALPDKAHLKAVRTSLGVASHHLAMNEKWLREMLDRALHDGVRDDAVRLLAHADLGRNARVALAHLGLLHITQKHLFPAPHPPHEMMIGPAADDPHAAVEVYSRHPEILHLALERSPHSEALERLVAQATTAHVRDGTPA
jgi:hypothetical protein